ncbi:hypothetical protein LXL04_008958 [Taraxacum kok-saghyz]
MGPSKSLHLDTTRKQGLYRQHLPTTKFRRKHRQFTDGLLADQENLVLGCPIGVAIRVPTRNPTRTQPENKRVWVTISDPPTREINGLGSGYDIGLAGRPANPRNKYENNIDLPTRPNPTQPVNPRISVIDLPTRPNP